MRTQLVAVFLLFAISAVAARGTVGFPSVDRAHLDSWRDAIYIPNPRSKLTAGFIESFELYAKRPGEIVLQVWRLVSGSYYKLIAQKGHHVVKAGKQEVFLSQPVRVNAGDIIGFYFPAHSIIPFDGHESCWHDRGLYVKSPKRAHVVVGKTFYFHAMRSGWNPCRQYSFSAKVIPVPGTAVGGYVSNKDRQFVDGWRNAMYIPDVHAVLPNGILWDYRLFARRPGQIRLQVFRRKGYNTFTLISETPYNVPSKGVHVVKPKGIVTVRKGDVLGFFFPGHSIIPFDGQECARNPGLYVYAPHAASVKPGRTFRFHAMRRGWRPCRQYSFNALVLKGVHTTEGFPATKDRKYVDGWRNAIYIPHPHKPLPKGLLTAYNFYARKIGKISLQVWRRVSGSIFELVHQEWHKVTSTGINKVIPKELVSIKKGDFLGFFFPYNSIIPFDGHECYHARGLYVHYPSSSSVTVGRRFHFRNMERGWNPCRQYSFNADVVKAE